MRDLGAMETALTLSDEFSPLNVVNVLRLGNGPTLARLRRALDALQASQPWLQARIVAHGSRRRFEAAAMGPIPLHVLPRQDDAHWLAIVEDELAERLPAGSGPLLRCTYVHDAEPGQASELILTCHHAIMDAGSAPALCRTLLALAAGDPAEAALPATAYPASDARLPQHWRGAGRARRLARFVAAQLAGEIAHAWRARATPRLPIPVAARGRALVRRTPPEVTAALVRRCRTERVTLNSALNAAQLLAVHRCRYSGRAAQLRGITFGNLRAYLQPPLPPEPLGSYITMLRYSVSLAASQGFWPLAHAIHAQITKLVHAGDKFASALVAPLLVGTTYRLRAFRLGTAALSYAGLVEMPAAIGLTQVLGLHGFVSNNRLGAEYTAAVRLFRDALWWDILYLDADMDAPAAAAIASEIEAVLVQATSGPTA